MHQADDSRGHEFGGEREQRADREVGDRPGALVARQRDAVDRRDLDRVAAVGGAGAPPAPTLALPAVQRADGRLQPAAREEREHREHAVVDEAGGDVVAGAA